MSMRLWVQKHTVEGRRPLLDAWYREHLASLVSDDTVIEIHTLPAQSYPAAIPQGVVRFGAVETFFSTYFARQAVAAEAASYDGFVIVTAQDPGLREARSLVGIPVLSYGETSFHVAAMTGQRFGVVGFIEELAEPLLENITAAHLEHRFVGFEYIENGAANVDAALSGDPGAFIDAYTAATRRAIARGAQVIIPGEGLPNEILWHEGITSIDGVPIIDSDGLTVAMAELLVKLTRAKVIGRSGAGYWFGRPDQDFLAHLAKVFWPQQ